MAGSLAPLRASLSLNISQFTRALKETQRAVSQAFGASVQGNINGMAGGMNNASSAANNLTGHLKSVERIVGGIMISQAFYGIATEVNNAAGALYGFMGNMEKAQISMRYFLGDAEKASSFLYNMQDFAAETSYSSESALKLSQRLLAAQFEASQVRSIMTTLNDAATVGGGTTEQLERIVLAITQIKTNGFIKGGEIRQLAEANIPIYKILQEQLKLTGAEVMRIGDLKIKGDLGVQAILTGLKQEYNGAAKELAQTLPGMVETIKDNLLMLGQGVFSYPYELMSKATKGIRDRLDELRDHLAEGGIGKAFESMFTPKTQGNIRLILGGIQSLGKSFMALGKAIGPGIVQVFSSLTSAIATIITPITIVARVIAGLTTAAFQLVPGLRYLVAAILALVVAQVAARALLLLWRITGMGIIASTVAGAVRVLSAAIRGLALSALTLTWPVALAVAAVLAIAGAVIYFTSTSKTAVKWLETLKQQLASLGGFDINSIFQPDEELNVKDLMGDFNEDFDITGNGLGAVEDGLDGVGNAADKAGDKADKAGKKIKDSFLASFDEVFNVPDKDDSGGADKKPAGDKKPGGTGGGGLGGGIGDNIGKDIIDKLPREIELPKLKWPEIPPLVFPKFTLPPINWPTIPPLIPILVGAWAIAWKWIKLKFKELQDFKVKWPAFPPMTMPDWPPLKLPNWGPIPLPKWGPMELPKWGPVVDVVKKWGDQLEGTFDALKEALQKRWGAAWGALPGMAVAGGAAALGAVAGWAASLGTGFDALKELLKEKWGQAWATMPGAIGAALALVLDTLGSWGTTIAAGLVASLANIAPVFTGVVTGLWDAAKTMVKGWMDSLANLWEDHKGTILLIVGAIALGVVLFFVGIPAGVVAAIGTLVARVVPAMQKLGPAILGAINGVPKIVNNVFKMLPVDAQETVKAIGKWFQELPGNISDFIKSIPDKFDTFMKELPKNAAKVVTDINTFFKELPGKLTDALKSIPADFAKHTAAIIVDVKAKIADIVKWFAELPGKLVTTLKGIPEDTVKMFNKLPENVKTTIANIVKWFAELPGKLVTAIAGIPANTAKMFDTLPGKGLDAITNVVKNFAGMPAKIVTALMEIPSQTSNMFDKLPGRALTAIGAIVKNFANLPGKIADAISDIPAKMANVFSKIKIPSFETLSGGVKATFKSIGNISGFAGGGIIDKDSIVRVGEGGRREAIVPLQNASAMKPFVDSVVQGVLAAMPSGGNNGGGDDKRPLYVGTLIADRRGLKELERSLKIVRLEEETR